MDKQRVESGSAPKRASFTRRILPGAALATGLAACAPGAPEDPALGSTAEEIIGGFPASTPTLNGIGALGFDPGDGAFLPFCSGTLITPTMVLTAEHCVDFIVDPAQFAFLIGPDAFAPQATAPARGAAAEQTVSGGVIGYGSDVAIFHLAEAVTDVATFPYAALTDAQLGHRLVGVGYGLQDALGAYGTRRAGSMTLQATGGPVFEAIYGSFEAFLEEGAPRLFPNLDPDDPEDLEILRQLYFEEYVLLDGIEAWFGNGPGDAQACFGDSGGPIIERVDDQPTVFGVTSWGFSFAGLCELGGGYASMNPISLDFIDYETQCPLIPREGTCDGPTVAVRCADPDEGGRRELRTDCGELGLFCGLDEDGAIGCIEDPCEGLPPEGVCDGDVAIRCSSPEEGRRRVVTTDCAAQGARCAIVDGTATCVIPPPGCDHDVCTTGAPLAPSCNECTAAVCAVDPFCCTIAWDEICVGRVQTVCKSGTCDPPPCDHDACTPGEPLAASCGSCEAAVCAADPYCCSVAWDSVCSNQVRTVCDAACPGPIPVELADLAARQRARRAP